MRWAHDGSGAGRAGQGLVGVARLVHPDLRPITGDCGFLHVFRPGRETKGRHLDGSGPLNDYPCGAFPSCVCYCRHNSRQFVDAIIVSFCRRGVTPEKLERGDSGTELEVEK